MARATVIKVLIVDDHHLVREGLRRIIDATGQMRVIAEAANGEDAVKLCNDIKKQNEPMPDVVLMDVRMPGMGGFETTRKLLRVYPQLRVLIVTICNNDIFPSRLLQLGAAGYITKDATAEEMVKAIRCVYAGQRYISAEIASNLALRHVQDSENTPFETLSEREMQVLMMITMGVKVPDIAEKLCLSSKTVNSYRYRIFEKLGVKNDVEMTLLAITNGLVEADNVASMAGMKGEED